jgi:DNA-binding MarR family transcriptional regulator
LAVDATLPGANSGQAASTLRLENYLPHRLIALSSVVSAAFSPIYTKHGMTLHEWRVLVTLGSFGELRSKEVGAHAGLHKTNVTRATQVLVERKLIEARRSPTDQRVLRLRLTSEGQQLYQQSSPLLMELCRRIEEAIEPTDREAFNRALMKLTQRAKQLASKVC